MIARFGIVLALTALSIFSVVREPAYITDISPGRLISSVVVSGSHAQIPKPESVLFVGDIMMGREVENLIDAHGEDYPFRNVMTLFETSNLTVGNFEGVVSEDHVKTPSMIMKFSIRDTYLTYLTWLGFDVLSLANNHSLDYGRSALAYTRLLCEGMQLICIGSPIGVEDNSTSIVSTGKTKIGIISLHTLYGEPSDEDVSTVLEALRGKSDVQIAYIHWGNEYELTHSTTQEVFAKKLIDQGIDAVIGHHPHVVQDIDMYNEKPIFYSLGNFIFDQYFDPSVQEGIGVRMEISDASISYVLVPFTSSKSQPDFMKPEEAEVLYQRIFSHIASIAHVDTKHGVITSKR